ncbi:MAG: CinA family nicotinamide mononucleotide deamidase-related protein, partial [Nitrospira sp.]|nr:CinA family nicotinamide mononucleotide deamidase-related protein [Nitrospira sp.]
ELTRLGIQVKWKTVVGDEEKDITEVLKRALQRSDLVMTTGGLGSTMDDLTKKVVAKVTRRRLVLKEDLLQDLQDRFQKRRHLSIGLFGKTSPLEKMPKSYERQALLPSQAQVLKNPVGTASGFILECGGHYLVVLPGVPHEMRRIFTDSVRGILQKLVRGSRPFVLQVIRTFGLTEAKVDEAIKDLVEPLAGQKLGLVAGSTGVDIYIMTRMGSAAKTGDSIEGLKETLRKSLGEAIYSEEGKDMEEVVGLALKKRGLQLAIAESCTGGLIGHRLTNIPGSSAYLERGVICYSDLSKIELLQVPAEIIARYGAVSSQVAIALAEGVRKIAKTDLGLGVTGIAGPGGDTPTKTVGLVHMALAYSEGTRQESFQFSGDRVGLKLFFSQAGLDLIRRHLLQS